MKPYRFYSFEFSCWGIDMRFMRTLLICGFIFSLVSCGGGGGGGKGSTSRDSAPGLPADPGQSANATLVGVDANSNGIRDEIEIQLSEVFRDDPPALNAALMSAKAFQRILETDASDTLAATASMDASSEAAICLLISLSYDSAKASAIVNRAFILTYNTHERIEQRKAVSSAVGVQSRSVSIAEPSC